MNVALEMIDDGLAGHLQLLTVDRDELFCGYACYGRASLTQSAWYLYWLCIAPEVAGQGIGARLQAAMESQIARQGGSTMVVETSGRADYARARHFYQRAGFVESGRLPGFYSDGDDCVIYCKSPARDPDR